MLLIPCPVCGERPEDEFGFGGDATVQPPVTDSASGQAEVDIEGFADYLYLRENPKGRHTELWVHRYGCRRWLVVERDTVTHELYSSRLAAGEGGE